jgi:hypothetical protein
MECERNEASMPMEGMPEGPPPWTEIEPGRFQPKRTRGSHLGRELG